MHSDFLNGKDDLILAKGPPPFSGPACTRVQQKAQISMQPILFSSITLAHSSNLGISGKNLFRNNDFFADGFK